MNWLNDAPTSNRLRQTYVSGFMDVSGGNVIVRNGDLLAYGNIVLGGNTSVINIIGTASFEKAPTMDGTNIIVGTIPPSAIGNGSGGSTSFGFMDVGTDQSIGGNKVFTGDVSFNGNTVIGIDASNRGFVRINGPTTFARNPVITGNGFVVDTSSNQSIIGVKTFTGDASFACNVILGNTIRRVAIEGNTTMARGITILSDMSMTNATGLLSLNGNVSLINSNRIFRVEGTSNLNGNVNIARELGVTGNLRVDSSLSVMGTTTTNGNVFAGGRKMDISGNLNVFGNSTIGRSGLSKNFIYGNTDIKYLSENTDGIEVTDGEIYLKGGDAHFGVITDAEESQFISDSATVDPGFRILSNAGSSVQWVMKRNSTGKLYTQNNNGWGVYMNHNSVAWSSESDQSLMYDSSTLTGSLSKILALNPITYKLLGDLNTRTQLGFKAQEVQSVISEAVTSAPYNEELFTQEGRLPLGITPTYMIPHLVRSVQELRNDVVVDVSSNQTIRGVKTFVDTLVGSDMSMNGNIVMGGNIEIKYVSGQEQGLSITYGGANLGRLYVDPSGPLVLSADDKIHIAAPEYCIADTPKFVMGGNVVMKNRQIIKAVNSAGVEENFLWGRENDNRTYLNYGAQGFNIRNNTNTSTMFMEDDGRIGIGTVEPDYTLDVVGNVNASSYIRTEGGVIVTDEDESAGLISVTQNGSVYMQAYTTNTIGSNAPFYFTSKYANNTYYSIIPETGGATVKFGINKAIPAYNLDVDGTLGIGSKNSPSAGGSVALTIYGPASSILMGVNMGGGNYNSLTAAGDSMIVSSLGGTSCPMVIGGHNGAGFRFSGSDTGNNNTITVRGNLDLNTEHGGSINCKNVILDNDCVIAGKNTLGTIENCLQPRGSDNKTYLNYGSGGLVIRTNGTGGGDGGTESMTMDDNYVYVKKLTRMSKSLEFNGTIGDDRQITASYLNLSNNTNVSQNGFQMYFNGNTVATSINEMHLHSSATGGNTYMRNLTLTPTKVVIGPAAEIDVPDMPYTSVETQTGFQLKSGFNYLYAGVSNTNNYSYIQASKNGVATTGLILNGRGGIVGLGAFPDNNYAVTISAGGNVRIQGNTRVDGNLRLRAATDIIQFIYNEAGASSSIFDDGNLTLQADDNVVLNAPGKVLLNTLYVDIPHTAVFRTKDSGGNDNIFLWPRWTDDRTYLNYGANGFHIRNNGATEVMFMTNGGNVGIGTTIPSYKLDVNGSSRVTGATYTNTLAVGSTSVGIGMAADITGNAVIRGNVLVEQNMYINNDKVIYSYPKDSTTAEPFIWPRYIDNATYLNYGTGGFYIRNNSSTGTIFMNNANNVGIGTTSPGYKLDVAGSLKCTSFTVDGVAAFGTSTVAHVAIQRAVTYSGYNWSGFMQFNSLDGVNRLGYIGNIRHTGNVGNSWLYLICENGTTGIYLGGGTTCVNGNLGVGTETVTAGCRMDVNGSVRAISYNAISDYRLKTNVEPLDSQLDTIRSLEPKSFVWKSDGKMDTGFLAQDIFKKYPHMRIGNTVGDEPVDVCGNPIYLAVDYSKLTPFLWKGMQELITKVERQDEIIESQTQKIEQQDQKIEQQNKEIELLKQQINKILEKLG